MSGGPDISGSDVAELETSLGHVFDDKSLLLAALTHPSLAGLRGGRGLGTYERLEFLGDRVLGLIVAEMLYRTFPQEDEGALARRFAELVRRESIARISGAIGLGRHLRLAASEAGSGGRDNPALLADAGEAVIAALYLDGGLEAARRFVEPAWRPLVAEEIIPPQDAKTALQEWAQGQGLALPVYALVSTAGPAHEPRFAVEVRVEGHGKATGSGKSKRAAEQAAAAAILARLDPDGFKP
ncbi:ribonuclease 3 [Hypericibacter terrae]|uniref:Ribonuclease 3 n=1 Tax=Hypericibacter terrae TaxID=2602015 RepID=A0A5J6MHZ4_9PROT|nr:ribonuclease III [Hypericibacter terrae]QEX16731.1 ribonuclease 3 [Hypericibacter terrae]